MFALVYRSAAERPTWAHWRSTAIIGGLLLLGGNGLVTWAEKTVPSGVAALLVTTVPIWMVLLHWMRRDGARPTLAEGAGVLVGFAGVAILIGSNDLGGGAKLDRIGAAALVLASLLWSVGSLYSRTARLPKSPLLATSMEMLCGGALLTLFGLLRGETAELGRMSSASLLALVYLILFGSLIGFTAYCWLLRVTTPARVATYAFVNPVVAVGLGCTLGNEPFTPRFIVASAIIFVAVGLVIASRARAPQVQPADDATAKTPDPIAAPPPHGSDAEVIATGILASPPDGDLASPVNRGAPATVECC
jgi:drug/metabolite transporter (DMT)-like permease